MPDQDLHLLEVKNLVTGFRSQAAQAQSGFVRAVDNISFQIKKGQTLGIVGESGCGKSVTSLSIMRLLPPNVSRVLSGQILFNGVDLLKISEKEMQKIRGNNISMIFQEPMTSLNPVLTIGYQVSEAIAQHRPNWTRRQVKERAVEMLQLVNIPEPAKRYSEYPHQLSGGMRQRVMIAMALSCGPQLLIADEPTTALDVTIQAQILELIRKVQKEFAASMILITHDLGVVAEVCDEVAVMYAGQIVEYASVDKIFTQPRHPYTQGLLNSVPHFESGARRKRLQTIPGALPPLHLLPQGCRFTDRCPKATQICREQAPPTKTFSSHQTDNQQDQHHVTCFFPLHEKQGSEESRKEKVS